MKFDQIILTGASSITLFDHRAPLSTPYVTRTVDGLGPTETNVSLAQTTQGAGIYIGRRPQLREVTFTLEMNPNYTIGETPETLRERLYLMRPVEMDGSLTLRLLLGGVEQARTPVYIKRMESPAFAKDTVMQLVLASPMEYFYRNTNVVEEPPYYEDKAAPIFVNEGSAPTGFYVKLQHVHLGVAASFGFRREGPEQFLQVVHPFVANDILEIDTRIGTRGVWLTRAGVRTSLLGAMSSKSTWITLHPGGNALRMIRPADDLLNFEWKRFEYQPKYVGV